MSRADRVEVATLQWLVMAKRWPWQAHGDSNRALGGKIQIIGSQEHVVDKLIGLKRAGCDGTQVAFVDFVRDLEFFSEAVLPSMHQAGLRILPEIPWRYLTSCLLLSIRLLRAHPFHRMPNAPAIEVTMAVARPWTPGTGGRESDGSGADDCVAAYCTTDFLCTRTWRRA